MSTTMFETPETNQNKAILICLTNSQLPTPTLFCQFRFRLSLKYSNPPTSTNQEAAHMRFRARRDESQTTSENDTDSPRNTEANTDATPETETETDVPSTLTPATLTSLYKGALQLAASQHSSPSQSLYIRRRKPGSRSQLLSLAVPDSSFHSTGQRKESSVTSNDDDTSPLSSHRVTLHPASSATTNDTSPPTISTISPSWPPPHREGGIISRSHSTLTFHPSQKLTNRLVSLELLPYDPLAAWAAGSSSNSPATSSPCSPSSSSSFYHDDEEGMDFLTLTVPLLVRDHAPAPPPPPPRPLYMKTRSTILRRCYRSWSVRSV
ncbi:hypothetical protein EX30DRAFT_38672 [Ascodesmis nigricans]|uniref:Uncharacterized protein n=1 Tax=Ascodesmis nigricans TaxID=341454 RepID=A0A4S2MH46_9PEZI|nr:hypothetical protein EX30DRAFT_38672 [Ascodesmis nigricans]